MGPKTDSDLPLRHEEQLDLKTATLPSLPAATFDYRCVAAGVQQGKPHIMAENYQPVPLPVGEKGADSPMEVDNKAGSEDRNMRATSIPSMDDIEAAQALEGLRSDLTTHSRSPSRGIDHILAATEASSGSPPPEPLLSLLLTSSPQVISDAINNGMARYSNTKDNYPTLKTGAEFIERNIGSKVVNAVGSYGGGGRMEKGLRWALQKGQTREANSESASPSKRVKSNDGSAQPIDVEMGMGDVDSGLTRRSSGTSFGEPLPPYDSTRSPKYQEFDAMDGRAKRRSEFRQQRWQTRLMVTTSGLSVAMSEESLRSLTYCLAWLRWANTRLGGSIISLKDLLANWEASKQGESSGEKIQGIPALAQQIQQLKADVLQTLKQVVNVVSKYAGGALPENARVLVRRHLISLPQRFRMASRSETPPDGSTSESQVHTNAHRVMVLAQEGLDILAQVSGVVNDTLVSAEAWCEKLRRRRPSAEASTPAEASQEASSRPIDEKLHVSELPAVEDVEMAGVGEKT